MSKNNQMTQKQSVIQGISCIAIAALLLFGTHWGHSNAASKTVAVLTLAGSGILLGVSIASGNPLAITGSAILVSAAALQVANEFSHGESEASVAPRELSRDSYRQTCGVSRAVSRLTLAVA